MAQTPATFLPSSAFTSTTSASTSAFPLSRGSSATSGGGGMSPRAAARAEDAPTSSFRSALQRAATSLADGDRMLARTLHPRGPLRQGGRAPVLEAPQLLELQAGVYRYTQELELAGRLVDRATQAVKTTLQSQT